MNIFRGLGFPLAILKKDKLDWFTKMVWRNFTLHQNCPDKEVLLNAV